VRADSGLSPASDVQTERGAAGAPLKEAIVQVFATYLKEHHAERGAVSINDAFQQRFHAPLPDELNDSHRLVSVAAGLDPSTERIVRYFAAEYDVRINAPSAGRHRRECSVLIEGKVGVERTHAIVGQPGHKHHPTLFVPAVHALVEPIGAEAPWKRATVVYASFGDVMKANGFSRSAVIDDRGDHVKDEIRNLLQQVGSPVYWSDRALWMERMAR